MNIIHIEAHPSNKDKTAALVESDRNLDWSIYRVTDGYCVTIRGQRAVEGLFPTKQAAMDAADLAMTLCPPGDGYPVDYSEPAA